MGLKFTFAPLFAKTWRIYRIFGVRKLKVIALTNRRLLLLCGALLSIELVLMAVGRPLVTCRRWSMMLRRPASTR